MTPFYSQRKFILAVLVILAVFTLIYTGTFLSIDNEDKFHFTKLAKAKESLKDDQVIRNYWLSRSGDEYSNLSMMSIHDIRSQSVATFNQSLAVDIRRKANYLANSDFSRCRMSNCFDFSRCRPDGPIKVHIVPSSRKVPNESIALGESNIIHRNTLKIIRESEHFEPNPEMACLFILEDDTLDRDPLSQSFLMNVSDMFGRANRYGMNHLVFNLYSGSWPDYRENDFAGLHFNAAILAKASNSIVHHRPGFDISLPLFSYLHPYSDSFPSHDRTEQQYDKNRSYFLTFKGKRYVFGTGSETRNNLYHLNNKRDTLMLTTCRHGKKWRDSSDARCSKDELYYDKYDFNKLMQESKFCVTPRGRRLGSFRYLEAISHGCIPVILSDKWVKPFDDVIDWSCASIQIAESLLLQVPDMLRDISENITDKMGKNCLNLFDEYFSSTKKIILSTLSIIEKRVKNRLINYHDIRAA